MCDNMELPLALIMEEILKWEKPNTDKEQDTQEEDKTGAAL